MDSGPSDEGTAPAATSPSNPAQLQGFLDQSVFEDPIVDTRLQGQPTEPLPEDRVPLYEARAPAIIKGFENKFNTQT